MKKMFLILVAFAAICTSSCNNNNVAASGDPKKVLTSFFDAMAKKDITTARKLATADSKGTFDMLEMGMKMADKTDTASMEQFDNSRMEMGEAKISGDQATVNVKEKKSGEAVDFVLKKEAGEWKVAMDMATLMSIGMQKMKEKGVTEAQMDSLRMGIDEMKKLNTDSIREIMKKGMQALDSVK
ncbi:MAG TPA: hypothetical protein VK489_11540 [Ferruginibacter sp.]|nr:hypothetical protein [Ferruginibacter sp.]